MKTTKYINYEENLTLTIEGWQDYYNQNIEHDTNECGWSTFEDWFHDMRKCGLLEIA